MSLDNLSISIRRSTTSDEMELLDLGYPSTKDRKSYFGRATFGSIIETSFMSLTAFATEEPSKILGFAAFNDQPPVFLCQQETSYHEYLKVIYDNNVVYPQLFLINFIQRSTHSSQLNIINSILRMAFTTLPIYQRIVLILPNAVDITMEVNFSHIFQPIPKFNNGKYSGNKLKNWNADIKEFAKFTPYQVQRSVFLPELHIRKAQVEDNDDLEPLLHQQHDQLTNIFGDYYLADLIQDQDDIHNACLIAHPANSKESRAVGMMAVSDEIDVSMLQKTFELDNYNNLMKVKTSEMPRVKISPPRMVLSGPPASGKGTQCDFLVKQFGMVHVSTGDILRSAIQQHTELGMKAEAFMNAGGLVPDELMLGLVSERLAQIDCLDRGWLLDGFPRTKAQADAMRNLDIMPDMIAVLELNDDEVVSRISGRRVDPETGKTYHLVMNPPPTNDLALVGRLIQRADDTETTVRNRLRNYHENNNEVLNSLTSTCYSFSSALIRVDGTGKKEKIAKKIIDQLTFEKQTQKFLYMVQIGQLSPPKLVISGAPASGKGTQCELLVSKFGVVHLSTGDILRASIKDGGELGMKAKVYMNSGELIPDEMIIDIVLERVAQPDCVARGWLLDGFPRTSVQAAAMITSGLIPDFVYQLDVPDSEVVRRISGRRVDPSTGKTYHLEYNPPPPELRDVVVQRSDDTESTVLTRLEKYHQNCSEVLESFAAYKPTNVDSPEEICVVRCDGTQTKDKILLTFTDPLLKRLNKLEGPTATTSSKPDNSAKSKFIHQCEKENASRNCFAVTLVCLDPQFEYGYLELLGGVFAIYDQRDFCLATIPTTVEVPSFLSMFIQVSPKKNSTFTHSLYLLHRDVLSLIHNTREQHITTGSTFLTVERFYPGIGADIKAIFTSQLAPLLDNINYRSSLELQDLFGKVSEENDVDLQDQPSFISLVVKAADCVVGMVVLSRNPDFLSQLRQYFDMDSLLQLSYHRSTDQVLLKYFILNPVFLPLTRFLLLDTMRQVKSTCILYPIQLGQGVPIENSKVNPMSNMPANSIPPLFMLVKPRRSIEISPEEIEAYPNEAELQTRDNKFRTTALYLISKKFISEPKTDINTRIVVAGASDCGITVLQQLLSVPYLQFTHITLVSPHGMTIEDRMTSNLWPAGDNEAVDSDQNSKFAGFARRSHYTSKELDQYLIQMNIRVIQSRIIHIDRQAKMVGLVDGRYIPYDYLILTTGLQDNTCSSLELVPKFDMESYSPVSLPRQLLVLGDPVADIPNQLKRFLAEKKSNSYSIIVYGSSYFVFQVVQSLLRSGVPGSSIHLVAPLGLDTIEDDYIQGELLKLLKSYDVNFYPHKAIFAIESDSEEGGASTPTIKSVHFKTTQKEEKICRAELKDQTPVASVHTKLPCDWLLCCEHNDPDYHIFYAINNAGLVYDKRLVVDGNFMTSDPYIFGAGGLCRFSRRYSTVKLQEEYSSIECGRLLAASILRLIDPYSANPMQQNPITSDENYQSSETHARKSINSMVSPPKMKAPVIRTTQFPGGKTFLQISVPTLADSSAMEAFRTSTDGLNSITGARYTCLKFDHYGILNQLVYFGDYPIEVLNFSCLVGLHEGMLNSAIETYANGHISDWIEFFHQKWASALYYDRFGHFTSNIHTMLKNDESIQQLINDAVNYHTETGDMKTAINEASAKIGRAGEGLLPSLRNRIEVQVLDFLRAHRDSLQMYFFPRHSDQKNDKDKNTSSMGEE